MIPVDEQADIMKETGSDTDVYVRNNIHRWWMEFDGDGEQRNRCKLRVLRYLLGQNRELVDRTVGLDKVAASQAFENIRKMIADTESAIAGPGKKGGSFTPKQAQYAAD